MASAEDVNGDGLLDLVVHVETEALQLTETDTQAELLGETFDGVPIQGFDTIRVVAALHVAGGPAESGIVADGLTHATLDSVVQQSLARLTAAGVEPHRVNALTQVDVQIADLPGSLLGLATLNIVWIDRDAAGYGWSVNSGSVDLFSAVTHEFGHVLGFRHHDDHDVMGKTLGAGVRQLASSRFHTGLNVDDGLGSVNSLGMSARSDGFFSPSRERILFAPFGPWYSGTRWADTRHRWFETLALPLESGLGTSDDDTDLGWSVKAASRSRDPLSTENLDRLFAESWESVEDEL